MEVAAIHALVTSELRHLGQVISDLESRQLEPDLFKKVRLQFGIYSMRDDPSHYMVRVGVPSGRITPEQLTGMAVLVEKFASNPLVHLTTRQDFQVYGVERGHLVSFLRGLAQLGLSTRETSGNVVRNIVCCPYAGVSPDEPFDVTPYALAVHHYFLRNPLTQLLPRKIKIAFEGCATTDHVRTSVHDIGVVAALKNDTRGFKIYVGGGLGSAPRVGGLLEAWTEESRLLSTLEAIIRVFDRYGDREHRGQARLKFLIEKMGWSGFVSLVLAERVSVWSTQSGLTLKTIKKSSRRYSYSSVDVSSPFIDPKTLRALAKLARRYAGEIRLSPEQGMVFRAVPEKVLPLLHKELRRLNLANVKGSLMCKINHCLGAECCLTAITRPRALADALGSALQEAKDPIPNGPLSVRISGCPNACSQHHIADIGLYGVALPVGAKHLPAYQILVGGFAHVGSVQFGQRLAKIPARRTPEAVSRLTQVYRRHRKTDENFSSFVSRVGCDFLRVSLADLADLQQASEQPEMFVDLGATEPFELKVGKSECAA